MIATANRHIRTLKTKLKDIVGTLRVTTGELERLYALLIKRLCVMQLGSHEEDESIGQCTSCRSRGIGLTIVLM